MDFGQAIYGFSKYLNKSITYESKIYAGKIYHFRLSKSYTNKIGVTTHYFQCSSCEINQKSDPVKERKIPKITGFYIFNFFKI
jgi:hypothetical protein